MQRVHIDDLTSFVQEYEDWDLLSLPAIAEQEEHYQLSNNTIYTRQIGQVLNPQLETPAILETIKNNLGSYHFQAQYQQKPIPEEGGLLKWKWFPFYEEEPQEGQIFQSWDTAITDTDFACITAKYHNNRYYILNIYRKKLLFPELKRQIKEFYNLYNKPTVIIEDKSSGSSLIQQLRTENIPISSYQPKLSKKERILVHSSILESGFVLLPKNSNFTQSFQEEITHFPYGKHDDQIDALSQLLDHKGQYSPAHAEVV